MFLGAKYLYFTQIFFSDNLSLGDTRKCVRTAGGHANNCGGLFRLSNEQMKTGHLGDSQTQEAGFRARVAVVGIRSAGMQLPLLY